MAQGMKNTVLDHLPAGTDADLAKGKIPHTLPDGVTNRAVYQDILQIALPASVELILSSFTSMADLIMVGNLGTWAITAVGLTTQPKFILMTMVMAMNVGSTALVAQSRGSGNREAAQKYARQAMLLNLTLSILLSVVGFVTARPLVLFHGCKGWAHFKCRNCLLADSDGRIRILFPDLDHHSASSRNWRFQNSHVL